MVKRMFLLCLTLIASVIVVSACSNNSESDAQPNEENQPASEAIEHDKEQAREVEDSAKNDELDSKEMETEEKDKLTEEQSKPESHSDGELPKPIEINEEVQEAGVTFTLDTITFKEDHITVSFHAINTRGHGVQLAAEGRAKGDDLGGITLKDDTGYDYRYLADVENHRIQLFDGEEVTGTVSFVGKIRDDATSLTLVFNPGEPSDRGPQFSFEDIKIER